MKVKCICNQCGSKDSFIYFVGQGPPSRICVVCCNRQTGIDMCVDFHQSDNPPNYGDYPCAKTGCTRASNLCRECQTRWDCSRQCGYDFWAWFDENKYKANLEDFDLSGDSIPF